ncbi:hypothetical protein T484DRAFT_1927772 [Baffinella frigidus]|nr:hypothetical protein T484DRAFT_1927772 [Cryptophyta sp. CCMP2293]
MAMKIAMRLAWAAGALALGLVLLATGSTRRETAPLALEGRRVRMMQGSVLAGPTVLAEQRESALESLENDIAKKLVFGLFTPSYLQSVETLPPQPREAIAGRRHADLPEPTEIVPEAVAFECNGEATGTICAKAVQNCIGQAEGHAQKLYEDNPKEATELRSDFLCQCFESNGCTPSCNVAMYMAWTSASRVRCAPKPPQWMASANTFVYGDTGSMAVLPSDVSRDYFPEYPNPAGHVFSPGMAAAKYDADPATWPEGFPLRRYPYPPGTRASPYAPYNPFLSTNVASGSEAFAPGYDASPTRTPYAGGPNTNPLIPSSPYGMRAGRDDYMGYGSPLGGLGGYEGGYERGVMDGGGLGNDFFSGVVDSVAGRSGDGPVYQYDPASHRLYE